MIKCPRCGSVAEDQITCKICGHLLVHEEALPDAPREKYAVNKYLFFYLLKKLWFSLLCLAGIGVLGILSKTHGKYFTYAILAGLYSLLIAYFPEKVIQLMSWKYSEDYAVTRIKISIYLGGIAGVLLALVNYLSGLLLRH